MNNVLAAAKQHIKKRVPKTKAVGESIAAVYTIDADGLRALADLGVTISTANRNGFTIGYTPNKEEP